MSRLSRCGKLLRLGAFLGLSACSALTYTPTPPPSSPFFAADGDDTKFYRAAARVQDVELSRCAVSNSCDRAHFTRGLIALFESRESAIHHFQNVIAMAPKSHLAGSSRSWVRLIHETSAAQPESLMAAATKRLVRDMVERDLAARRKVEELSAQLKKSEELSDQLLALKRIQQEIKERTRPVKAPTKFNGARNTDPPALRAY